MQSDTMRRDAEHSAQRRVQIVRRRRPRELEPLDLRTPSGRVLPY
ncbi:MAG TPA: hypothetical protein VFN97_22945 [Actinospica sp.]|nr:hypothetical protein [Actinospica sp.]